MGCKLDGKWFTGKGFVGLCFGESKRKLEFETSLFWFFSFAMISLLTLVYSWAGIWLNEGRVPILAKLMELF